VISLQGFRDLFAEATLRPGDEAGVSQVALLFTDLQGSTALYERVGNAAAFNMVREHFPLHGRAIRDVIRFRYSLTESGRGFWRR
jgi:class 3 adenylate cyclase